MRDLLKDYAANENNPKWEQIIKRSEPLYSRNPDLRNPFERDYTRVIHSDAYRRLKHKTQVFFSPEDDHICTRIEHVTHVESISSTIAKYFGLNADLTKAIATAHDIGHSAFGHQGEKILSELAKKDLGETFWHERNGMEIMDKIELLEDPNGNKQNMNLTYAVLDGIISHCGEIDENHLKPREEAIDLYDYKYPNEYAPFTWEGCVVKIADKIAYLGRDIADAITLGILDENIEELHKILNHDSSKPLNNTVLINEIVFDLCENSNLEKGLCFSKEMFRKINEIKKFNYKNIYFSDKLQMTNKYFEVILTTIYDVLKTSYSDRDKAYKICPKLIEEFEDWMKNYKEEGRHRYNRNKVVFNSENEKDYLKGIIYYISGMTDNYAIEMYNRIIKFGY